VRRITEPAKAKAGEAVATTKASTTCAAPKKRNNNWKKTQPEKGTLRPK